MTEIDIGGSRYDRQERIWWWDQSSLRAARVLVVGAGALGNEIVKNLALVGVGSVDVVDMDRIEHSNLARCALFRERDEGRFKAEALADAANDMNSDISVQAFVCRVQAFGMARLRQYDVVIGGLDNREARLWVNQAMRLIGGYWVDGAIEGLQGVARVFGPEGPCYECTLGETDRELLAHRRSCALLSPEALDGGRTPTNATTASIIGGLQVQEAIKILVGQIELVALVGAAWRMEGETMLSSLVGYSEDPNCLAHDRADEWVTLDAPVRRLVDVTEAVKTKTGLEVDTLFFPDDLIGIGDCLACGLETAMVGLRGVLPDGAGQCPQCGSELPMEAQASVGMGDPLMQADMQTWYWPMCEAVAVRGGTSFVHVPVEVTNG